MFRLIKGTICLPHWLLRSKYMHAALGIFHHKTLKGLDCLVMFCWKLCSFIRCSSAPSIIHFAECLKLSLLVFHSNIHNNYLHHIQWNKAVTYQLQHDRDAKAKTAGRAQILEMLTMNQGKCWLSCSTKRVNLNTESVTMAKEGMFNVLKQHFSEG